MTDMKKILIMGATSGIGLQLAEEYASRGWRVGAAGRSAGQLARLAALYPDGIVCRAIDINSADAPAELEALIGEMGGMDVYLHVAGIGYDNLPLRPREEIAVMETNVTGFTRMVGAAFRWFRDHSAGRGHIAAVTSVAGTNGLGCLPAYSASKSCQQTYLRALEQLCAIEKLDIRFTDIRPGWIRTPLLDDGSRYPLLMTVPYAVSRIVRAIGRRRRVAVIDWRWNLIVGLWRLVPDWLWVRIPFSTPPLASRGGNPKDARHKQA